MANWIFCSLPYLTLLRVLCWFLILHLTFTLIPPGSQSRPTCLSYRLFLGDLKTLNTTYILKVKVKLLSRCPTLCDPMDCSLPGSSVHGIFQARVLEWVIISFSRGSFQSRDRTQVSHCRQMLYRLSHQGSPYIYWWLLNLDVEPWLLLRTLMYNCLLHICIWILNRHLRHYMAKTKLLIFSLQTCFSCTTTDYVSYFPNVEFIFDFSLFISQPNLLACSVFKIPISIASLHLHYFNSNKVTVFLFHFLLKLFQ